MSDGVTISPEGARILSRSSGMDAAAPHLIDCTDPAGSAPACCEAEVTFVLVAGETTAPPADEHPAHPAQVALVASADTAASLRSRGWPGPVVVEVALDERAAERLAALRGAGELVGVVTPPDRPEPPAVGSTRPPGPVSGAGPGVAVDAQAQAGAARVRGRTIGLLTNALLSGVATIRTDDPVTARRVRSVVAALIGPEHGNAKMDS